MHQPLKQVGLGFQTYQNTFGVFPDGGKDLDSGTTCGGGCCSGANRGEWNWCYQILPFVEQASLYEQPKDSTIHTTPVPMFYCPTRRAPLVYGSYAHCDYAGNAGDGMTAYNGAVIKRRCCNPMRMADITDGTSNTLLVGEKQTNVKNFGGSGGDNETWVNSGWDQDEIRWTTLALPPAPDAQHPDESTGSFWSSRFGSSHPGVFNGVLVDGSVRSFSFTMDPEMFRRTCVRNDGLPTTLP